MLNFIKRERQNFACYCNDDERISSHIFVLNRHRDRAIIKLVERNRITFLNDRFWLFARDR